MASSRNPRPLDPVEVRALGSLLEKEQLDPEGSPLSLHALVAACNQKTSREPVMELSSPEVAGALERLRQHVLVWRSEGGRVEKWRPSVDRRWGLDAAGKALMTVLLLRGPQTPGELRGRAQRLHPFESVAAVEAALRRMAALDEPLLAELPRRPGQKEARWTHLVGEGGEPPEVAEAGAPPTAAGTAEPLARRVERLEELLRELAAEVERLKSGR